MTYWMMVNEIIVIVRRNSASNQMVRKGYKQTTEHILKRVRTMQEKNLFPRFFGNSNPMKNPVIAKKVSDAKKGKRLNKATEFKKGHSLGKWFKSGKEHPSWKGGIAYKPYSKEFNNYLKEEIRTRDNYRCQECFRHQSELKRKLSIHHIDFNKKNNHTNNLISLCAGCHAQTGWNREEWILYYQNRIGECLEMPDGTRPLIKAGGE